MTIEEAKKIVINILEQKCQDDTSVNSTISPEEAKNCGEMYNINHVINAVNLAKETLYNMEEEFKKDLTELVEKFIEEIKQKVYSYPPCLDCNSKMDEIRRAYDKLVMNRNNIDTLNKTIKNKLYDIMNKEEFKGLHISKGAVYGVHKAIKIIDDISNNDISYDDINMMNLTLIKTELRNIILDTKESEATRYGILVAIKTIDEVLSKQEVQDEK